MERAVSRKLHVGRPYGYHVIVSSMSAVPLPLDVLVQVPQVLFCLLFLHNCHCGILEHVAFISLVQPMAKALS